MHRNCVSNNKITAEVYKNVFMKAFGLLVGFFETAQAKGILGPDMFPRDRAQLFIGGLIHTVRIDPLNFEIFGVSLKDPVYRERMTKSAIAMAMEGTSA